MIAPALPMQSISDRFRIPTHVNRWLGRFCTRVDSPVSPFVPIFSEHFGRVLGATGTVSALQRIHRAVFVASPAGALGVFWVQRKFFGHVGRFEKQGFCTHIPSSPCQPIPPCLMTFKFATWFFPDWGVSEISCKPVVGRLIADWPLRPTNCLLPLA